MKYKYTYSPLTYFILLQSPVQHSSFTDVVGFSFSSGGAWSLKANPA